MPANNARGRGNYDYETLGGVSMAAGRLALRWEPTERLEINISGDYTSDQSEANPIVLIAAGQVVDFARDFDPFSANPATDAVATRFCPEPMGIRCRWIAASSREAPTAATR